LKINDRENFKYKPDNETDLDEMEIVDGQDSHMWKTHHVETSFNILITRTLEVTLVCPSGKCSQRKFSREISILSYIIANNFTFFNARHFVVLLGLGSNCSPNMKTNFFSRAGKV